MITSSQTAPCLRNGVKYSQWVTGPRYPQKRSLQVVRSTTSPVSDDTYKPRVVRIVERKAMHGHPAAGLQRPLIGLGKIAVVAEGAVVSRGVAAGERLGLGSTHVREHLRRVGKDDPLAARGAEAVDGPVAEHPDPDPLDADVHRARPRAPARGPRRLAGNSGIGDEAGRPRPPRAATRSRRRDRARGRAQGVPRSPSPACGHTSSPRPTRTRQRRERFRLFRASGGGRPSTCASRANAAAIASCSIRADPYGGHDVEWLARVELPAPERRLPVTPCWSRSSG